MTTKGQFGQGRPILVLPLRAQYDALWSRVEEEEVLERDSRGTEGGHGGSKRVDEEEGWEQKIRRKRRGLEAKPPGGTIFSCFAKRSKSIDKTAISTYENATF